MDIIPFAPFYSYAFVDWNTFKCGPLGMLHGSAAQPKAASCTLGTNSAAESRSLSLQ